MTEKKNITLRGLVPAENYTFSFSEEMFANIKKSIWPKLRTIPKQVFSFPAEITLYGEDKVSIVKFDKDNPVAIIIKDKMIYDMIGMFFEIIWANAQPVAV